MFLNISPNSQENTCVAVFNKIAGLRPATLLKKTPTQVFSCEFCEFFKNNFFYGALPVAASVTPTQNTWHG